MVFNLNLSDVISATDEAFEVPHSLMAMGHGYTKYLVVRQGKQSFLSGPSKFPSILRNTHESNYAIADRGSALVEIIESTIPDLKGRKLVGKAASNSSQSVSAGKQNKYASNIAPWLLFAAIGLSVPKGKGIKEFSFNTALSRMAVLLPDPKIQATRNQFLDSIHGEHKIRITKMGELPGTTEVLEGHIIINRDQVGLFAEGSMAFVYCRAENLIGEVPEDANLISVDIGHNTAIVSLLTPDGISRKRQVFPRNGCVALIDAICESPEMRELARGVVDPNLVAEGIINRNDNLQTAFYGQPLRGLNFYPIYKECLANWQADISSLIPEVVNEAIAATIYKVIAVGKPVELFDKNFRIQDFDFLEFPAGCDRQYTDLLGLLHWMSLCKDENGKPLNLLA